jgi:hypothetical protein
VQIRSWHSAADVSRRSPFGSLNEDVPRARAAPRAAGRRLATVRQAAMAASVTLDVFGNRTPVERSEGVWRTYLLGADGKRSIIDVAVPESVAEDDLAQYFDDLYHEAATPKRPAVVRLCLDRSCLQVARYAQFGTISGIDRGLARSTRASAVGASARAGAAVYASRSSSAGAQFDDNHLHRRNGPMIALPIRDWRNRGR